MIDRPGIDAVSAELIANRGFTVSRRGFEQEEVRAFLELVADAVRAQKERAAELEAQVVASREAAKNPVLDEDTLMRLVGQETGAILRSARAAAAEMRAKAEAVSTELVGRAERETAELRATVERETGELRAAAESETAELRATVERETAALRAEAMSEVAELRATAERETGELRAAAESDTSELRAVTARETGELRARAEAEASRVVDEARQQAGDLRTSAEDVVARAEAEAEQASTRIRGAAQESADQLVGRARREAESLHQQAEHDRRLTVEGAQAVREKILGDLARRRRVAAIQIEQLRAGRERLLQSYAVVRRTLEEVNDELHRADAEARDAAAEAARRLEEGGPDAVVLLSEGLDDDLAALGVVGPAETTDSEPSPVPESSSHPESSSGPGSSSGPEGSSDSEDSSASVDLTVAEAPVPEAPVPEAPVFEAPVSEVPAVEPPTPGKRRGRGARKAPATPVVPSGSGAAQVAEPAAGGVAVVDDLFARLRADREDAPDLPAEEPSVSVETEAPSGAGRPSAQVTETAEPGKAEPETAEPGTAEEAEDEGLEPKRSYEEESWLQLRDSALGETETALTRKLKRALQDEQNDLLDRLRMVRGRPTADALLTPADEQRARYAAASTELIERGARQGTDFALLVLGEQGSKAGPPGRPAGVDDLVAELAAGVVDPLRRRLAQTIGDSADEDQSVLVEALGAAYREWKTQRIERLAGDVLAGAFARGTVHATPKQATLRWVVDDVDGPCPDCDDNVLAGSLPRTEAFPTGQRHPPAHAGCRCIVVPAPA